MSTLGQRIRALRTQLHLTQSQLAERCRWDLAGQGRIANYEKDRREPNLGDLRKIASALGVSVAQLLDPDGLERSFSSDDFVVIKQYTAQGSAGNGHMNDHVEITGGLAFKWGWLQRRSLSPDNLHVIYVQGESMETTISDGDVVVMDESQTEPQNNRIYVIRLGDGELLIKRLIKTLTGSWIVRSDNEDKRRFPDFELTDHDLSELTILGRIVWHGGDL